MTRYLVFMPQGGEPVLVGAVSADPADKEKALDDLFAVLAAPAGTFACAEEDAEAVLKHWKASALDRMVS